MKRIFKVVKIDHENKENFEEETQEERSFNNQRWKYKKESKLYARGKWSLEEDKLLLELVNKYGQRWAKISKEMTTRSGRQIRNRYYTVFAGNNSKFTLDEEILIFDLYKIYGPKWTFIASFFQNRSADRIKNRFHSSIKTNENIYKIIGFLGKTKTIN